MNTIIEFLTEGSIPLAAGVLSCVSSFLYFCISKSIHKRMETDKGTNLKTKVYNQVITNQSDGLIEIDKGTNLKTKVSNQVITNQNDGLIKIDKGIDVIINVNGQEMIVKDCNMEEFLELLKKLEPKDQTQNQNEEDIT